MKVMAGVDSRGLFVIFSVFLLWTHVEATAQASSDESTWTSSTSLTVGYLNTQFTPGGIGGNLPLPPDRPESGISEAPPLALYVFDGAMQALMFSGTHGSLSVAYGNQEGSLATLRLIDTFITLGGNIYLIDNRKGLQFAAFLPIRLNGGYRYASLDADQIREAALPSTVLPDLHRAHAGLGAGGGAEIRSPEAMPFLRDRLAIRASALVVPGGYTDLGADFESVYLSRVRDINIEVKLERVLGHVGFTLGYTRRSQYRTPDEPESVSDFLDLFTNQANLVQVGGQDILRLGINW